MTQETAARSPLLRFALEGDRVRRAATILERESPRLVAALKRAIPFLSRRGVPISLFQAQAMPVAELLESLARPFHVTHLVTQPGEAAGALVLDAGAVAIFLDGVLGGDGLSLPVLNPAGLSGPQTAMVAGLAGNILRAFTVALQGSIGLGLEARPANLEQAPVESAIACVLELGEGDRRGRVALLLAKEPLVTESAAAQAVASPTLDPRIATVLEEVELTVVAELARVFLKVGHIASLKVGDTLRLDVPVSGLVSVRASGRELMRGRPTTSGGRIAVKILPEALVR
jgi:flagellar motor switch protein FliM